MKSKRSLGIVVVGLAAMAAKAPAQERVKEVTPTRLTHEEPLEIGDVAAVGTAKMMTYQGFAEKAGVAINNQSMVVELRAFPALIGGTQQGVTVSRTLSASEVYKGSFAIDFDAAQLALPENADETYLEVAICSPAPCAAVAMVPRTLVTHAALAMSARNLGDAARPGPNGSLEVASSAAASGEMSLKNQDATNVMSLSAANNLVSASSSTGTSSLNMRALSAGGGYTEALVDDSVGEMRLSQVTVSAEDATAAISTKSVSINAASGEIAASRDAAAGPLQLTSRSPGNSQTYMLLNNAAKEITFGAENAAVETAGITPPVKLRLSLEPAAMSMAATSGANPASIDFKYGSESAMRVGEDPEALGQAVMMVGPKGILLAEESLAAESNVAAAPSNYVRFQVLSAVSGNDAQGGAAALGPKFQVQSVSSGVPSTLMQIDAATSAATFYGAEGVSAARVRMDSGLASNVAGTSPSAELSVNDTTGNVELKVGTEIVDRWTPVGDTGVGFAANRISGSWENQVYPGVYGAVVGGGLGNSVGSVWGGAAGTVAGGSWNIAGATASVVSGGHDNRAFGYASAVGGGTGNQIGSGGDYSFVAGRRGKPNHGGDFIWADSTDADFASDGPNKFLVRASGGTDIYSNSSLTAGVTLAAGGGSWSSVSDKNLKENFAEIDKEALLEKLSAIPVTSWNYKSQDSSIRHIGPMGQDFHSAFGVGETETRLSTIDVDGVALAAIQGLYQIVQDKDCEIMELRENKDREIAELREKMVRIEAIFNALTSRNTGGTP